MSDATIDDAGFEGWAPRVLTHVFATALGMALLGAAATLVVTLLSNLPAAPRADPAPPVEWRDIVKPVRIYDLDARIFAGAPVTYAARRHETGGGREDVLALGRLDGIKPGLRLRMFRRGDEAPSTVPLYAAIAHEAAQVGLGVAHSGLPDLLPTRFGAFDVVDVALSPSDEMAPVPCGGFRLMLDAPALSITGLACGTRAAPISRAQLGCLIERLDVASARDDRTLVDFFAARELHRNPACTGARLAPDTVHAAWLDEAAADDVKDTPAAFRRGLRQR